MRRSASDEFWARHGIHVAIGKRTEHRRGRQTLRHPLAGGRGALLWVMPFRYSALVTKIAFAQEGWTVSHLSGLDHLAPNSRLACALLNQARTTIERRNLAEHLMIERDNVELMDSLSSCGIGIFL